MTIAVLFLPKIFAATLALADRTLRRRFGGTGRLLASLLIEQLFSILLAPAMMMFHTSFVISTLAGKPVSWQAQDRGDRGIGFLEALARHKWHVLLGVVWGAALLVIAPRYLSWMSPVLAGLILSVPLTMVTSRASIGRWFRQHRLLLTPEETETPSELVALERGMASEELLTACAIEDEETLATGTGPVMIRVVPLNRSSVPVQVPLAMEPTPLIYVHPRDAVVTLQRLVGAAQGSH
jgi:membrane glycosyltransferase